MNEKIFFQCKRVKECRDGRIKDSWSRFRHRIYVALVRSVTVWNSFFNNQNPTMGVMSIISFVLALIFFTLFVMSDKPEFKNTIIDNEGLWQRLNLAFMYLPLVITAISKISV